MEEFDNKTIIKLYRLLNEFRRKFKEKVKTTSNVMIAINDTGDLTLYFYAHFNHNVYDSSRRINSGELMATNIPLYELMDLFIDAAAKAIRLKIREVEGVKHNEH